MTPGPLRGATLPFTDACPHEVHTLHKRERDGWREVKKEREEERVKSGTAD